MRKTLLALVVLIALAAGLLVWLLSDPNRFKSDITRIVRDNTGLIVEIDGDLDWRLWPPVLLVARDVRADWSADAAEPFLRVAELTLDVDLWPLLAADSKLVVQGVRLEGLDARLVQRGERASWQPPDRTDAPTAPLPVAVPPPDDSNAGWEIAAVAIEDSTLHYDLDGDVYDVAIEQALLAGLAPGRTTPTRARLSVAHDGATYEIDARAQVVTSADASVIELTDAEVEGRVEPRALPFRATFAARYDVADARLAISGAAVELDGVKATLELDASDLRSAPALRGRIDLPSQTLQRLAPLETATLAAPVALSARYSATAERVELEDLDLRYGDTVVKGKAGIRLSGRRAVTFDLTTNAFEWPTRTEARPVAIGAGGLAAIAFAAPTLLNDPSLDEPILPLEQVRALDWDGRVLVERLLYDETAFPNARIATRNTNGRIDGTVDLPQFFGGTARADWSIDANGTPRWNVKPRLERVDSRQLLAWLDQKYTWAALLLGNADLTMTGNTPRELASSVRGATAFDGGQGKLDIGIIKEQALAVADVAGGTEKVQAWPDILDYRRFTGTWDVDGKQHKLRVLLDNLALGLDGTFDPFTEALDMTATVKLLEGTPYQTFVVDSLLMGVDVPVRCTGSAAEPNCKADVLGVKNLLSRAIRSDDPATREKLDRAIDEKVPEQYRDAARSLLDLLREGGSQPSPPP